MMYEVIAINMATDERVILGYFESEAEAWDNIQNNLEWDEDDNPADWGFDVIEMGDEFPEDYWSDDADECGFDPYEGCYTYDC